MRFTSRPASASHIALQADQHHRAGARMACGFQGRLVTPPVTRHDPLLSVVALAGAAVLAVCILYEVFVR